ncbi:hypothetical protein [Photobacterium andalusiense]|uniref:Uncharacterized protein n=1 Tax=Photobacterium andalusiense TaxID=2204296 RepID=A0A1Y6MJV7_9GAMM|nr:hypothetical protein [Photobacterium andalusiense]SMY36189.1 hypothetical protein PAND9192_02518 [Photobacterium andalusiense]
MTKHFSLSVLAILTSFSVSAATLDVHGEIKVNGKTVIDNKGNLIQDKSDLIDLDDYFDAKPNSIVTLKSISSENSIYNFYYDENGRQSKETQSIDDTITWSMEWKDRKDMSNTVVKYSKWVDPNTPENSHEMTETGKNEFTVSTSYPQTKVGITMARGDIYTYTIVESSEQNAPIGKAQQMNEYQYLTVLEKTSYKSEKTTIEDCIIVLQDASWMLKPQEIIIPGSEYNPSVLIKEPQIRTYCKDYGLVQVGDFKL